LAAARENLAAKREKYSTRNGNLDWKKRRRYSPAHSRNSIKEDGMRFCFFVALALFTLGCSDQGAAQDANAPVKILTSQMYVTIRNDSGAPLSDVTVSIVPIGRQTIYNKYVGRLESSESHNVMLGEFLGRDGTPFSLRVVKPRSVEIKGKDVKGKDYTAEVAWR
jgi:hypothetical protein